LHRQKQQERAIATGFHEARRRRRLGKKDEVDYDDKDWDDPAYLIPSDDIEEGKGNGKKDGKKSETDYDDDKDGDDPAGGKKDSKDGKKDGKKGGKKGKKKSTTAPANPPVASPVHPPVASPVHPPVASPIHPPVSYPVSMHPVTMDPTAQPTFVEALTTVPTTASPTTDFPSAFPSDDQTPSDFPSFFPSFGSGDTLFPTELPSEQPSLGLPECAEPCLDTCLPFFFLLSGGNETAAEVACAEACPCIIKCYRTTQECDDLYDDCVFTSRPESCICLGGSAINDFWTLLSSCGEDTECQDVCTQDLGRSDTECADDICPCAQTCFDTFDDVFQQQTCVNNCLV